MRLLPRGFQWTRFLVIFVLASMFVDGAFWLYDNQVPWRAVGHAMLMGGILTVGVAHYHIIREAP